MWSRFTTVRGIILGVVTLLCIASTTITWTLYSYLTYKTSLIVITAVPVFTAVLISGSLLCRPIAKKLRLEAMFKQIVIWEVIWSVGLVPFNIILCSISVAIEPSTRVPHVVHRSFIAMKAIFIANAVLLTTYSLVVYALATAMYYTIDKKVWSRDIYSDPGPFPIHDFIKYWRSGSKEEAGGAMALGIGLRSPDTVPPPSFPDGVRQGVEQGLRPASLRTIDSIVSVPTVLQRRSQIIVQFEEVRRE